MSFSMIPSEMVGSASNFCSDIPRCGRPHHLWSQGLLQWFAPATHRSGPPWASKQLLTAPEPKSQCPSPPPRESQAVVSVPAVQMICASLTLLFSSQACCCALFSILEIPLTQLIFLFVRLLLRVWVPFLLHSSLSGKRVLS